ncbi:MAG: hypothetical protein OEM02_02490, partial [Desulfobulbaceae bacterium]|nr:hypothetical protein [Desulfobulbaceae bacterium]
MHQLLIDHPMILIEAAVLEVLRRGGKVCLHPLLMNGTLIYELVGRQELRKLYLSYGEIALEAGL